jgi:hypothetical protein
MLLLSPWYAVHRPLWETEESANASFKRNKEYLHVSVGAIPRDLQVKKKKRWKTPRLPRRRTAIGERSIGAFTRENVFVVGNNLNGPCIDLAYIDKARRKESLDRRLTFLMIFTTIYKPTFHNAKAGGGADIRIEWSCTDM